MERNRLEIYTEDETIIAEGDAEFTNNIARMHYEKADKQQWRREVRKGAVAIVELFLAHAGPKLYKSINTIDT